MKRMEARAIARILHESGIKHDSKYDRSKVEEKIKDKEAVDLVFEMMAEMVDEADILHN